MKIEIADSYRPVTRFLESVPMLFDKGEGELLYHERNEVRRLEHKGLVFIAKRYKHVNLAQSIAYTFFRPTKAARAYRYASEFRKRGVQTPREIAYIETHELGLFTVGYFISEECHGRETHLDLREVENYDPELAHAVARQMVFMHSRGILHGDTNLTNFLYERQGDTITFNMIDINRSHFTDGWPTDEQCLQNLVRLTHRRDLYEFLVRSYARLRGWDENDTAQQALQLLDRFENKRFRL
ncbi:MAG: hypothetical protein IKH22_10005 [Prevotella sp.]|nr:hypothetical protein [Prevotella sp.]